MSNQLIITQALTQAPLPPIQGANSASKSDGEKVSASAQRVLISQADQPLSTKKIDLASRGYLLSGKDWVKTVVIEGTGQAQIEAERLSLPGYTLEVRYIERTQIKFTVKVDQDYTSHVQDLEDWLSEMESGPGRREKGGMRIRSLFVPTDSLKVVLNGFGSYRPYVKRIQQGSAYSCIDIAIPSLNRWLETCRYTTGELRDHQFEVEKRQLPWYIAPVLKRASTPNVKKEIRPWYKRHESAILSALFVIAATAVVLLKVDLSETNRLIIGYSAGSALLIAGAAYVYHQTWKKHLKLTLFVTAIILSVAILIGFLDCNISDKLLMGCAGLVAVVAGVYLNARYSEFKFAQLRGLAFRGEGDVNANEDVHQKLIKLGYVHTKESVEYAKFVDKEKDTVAQIERERKQLPSGFTLTVSQTMNAFSFKVKRES